MVFAALANLGYAVSYRVLNSRHFGVPQRRRRVFIVAERDPGPDGAPSVLFEPEGGEGDPLAIGHPWPGAAGAAAVGASAGSGQRVVLDHYYVEDFEDGTLTSSTGRIDRHPLVVVDVEHALGGEDAPALTSNDGTHGHRSIDNQAPQVVRYDVKDEAATLTHASNPNSNAAGRRREDDVNLVVEEHYFVGGTEDGTLRANGAEDSTGHAGNRADQQPMVIDTYNQATSEDEAPTLRDPHGTFGDALPAVLHPEPQVFESRVARNGRGAPRDEVPALKAESGETGKGDGAPMAIVPEPTGLTTETVCPSGPDLETGEWPCEPVPNGDGTATCSACGVVAPLARTAFRQHGHAKWVEDDQAETLNARDWRDGTLTMVTDDAPDDAPEDVYCIQADALGRSGKAGKPSPDAKGNVRLRDPGLGIREGEAYTLTGAGGPPAVAYTKGHASSDADSDPENWREDDESKTLHTMGFPPTLIVQPEGDEDGSLTPWDGQAMRVHDDSGESPALGRTSEQSGQTAPIVLTDGLESGVPTSERVYDVDGEAPTLQSSSSPGRGGSEGPKVLIKDVGFYENQGLGTDTAVEDGSPPLKGCGTSRAAVVTDEVAAPRLAHACPLCNGSVRLDVGRCDRCGAILPGVQEEEALAFAWQQGDDSGATGTGRGRSWVARAAPGYAGALSHSRHDAVQYREVVRRLMPVECERLQALPDNWTQLEPHGPDGKGGTPDGPRYAGIGDAVSSCVGWWVASRARKKIEWLKANAVR